MWSWLILTAYFFPSNVVALDFEEVTAAAGFSYEHGYLLPLTGTADFESAAVSMTALSSLFAAGLRQSRRRSL